MFSKTEECPLPKWNFMPTMNQKDGCRIANNYLLFGIHNLNGGPRTKLWGTLWKDKDHSDILKCLVLSRMQDIQFTVIEEKRKPERTLFTIFPNSPTWLPSSMTSTGFLLQPALDSWRLCWPSGPSTALHQSSSNINAIPYQFSYQFLSSSLSGKKSSTQSSAPKATILFVPKILHKTVNMNIFNSNIQQKPVHAACSCKVTVR